MRMQMSIVENADEGADEIADENADEIANKGADEVADGCKWEPIRA